MRLPQEPPEGTQNVTAIRFRLPSGECLQRRFYLDSDVSVGAKELSLLPSAICLPL